MIFAVVRNRLHVCVAEGGGGGGQPAGRCVCGWEEGRIHADPLFSLCCALRAALQAPFNLAKSEVIAICFA